MTLVRNGKKHYTYHTTDINEAIYIYHSILDNILEEPSKTILIKLKSIGELIDEINKIHNKKDIDRYIIEYQSRYSEIKINFTKNNLKWISVNSYAGFYLWFKLFFIDDRYSRTIQSTPESLEKIYFDIINIAMSDIDGIPTLEKIINRTHKSYQKISGTKRLSWLKNDDRQIQWAYQYLKEKDRQFRKFYFGDPINLLDIIKVYYDLNIDNRGVKLTYIEMNNAWNQHRYRESRKDKKALSGYISSDAKIKLTQMAKKSRMPEYELLELLILEQYDRDNQKN